jgi:hypothetical protein
MGLKADGIVGTLTMIQKALISGHWGRIATRFAQATMMGLHKTAAPFGPECDQRKSLSIEYRKTKSHTWQQVHSLYHRRVARRGGPSGPMVSSIDGNKRLVSQRKQ